MPRFKVHGIEIPASFESWLIERMERKGFDWSRIDNPYAFIRGILKRWKPETLKRKIEQYEQEKSTFLGGLFSDIDLPF